MEGASTAPSSHRLSAAPALRAIDGAFRVTAIAGGALILAAGALICIEVVLRKLFNLSLGFVEEVSGYALAIGSAWSFPYCLRERCHIRIDTVYARLGESLKIALDVLALGAMIAFFAVVAVKGVETAMTSFRVDARAITSLNSPLYIPQAMWAAGIALFVAAMTYVLGLALFRLLRGLRRDAALLIGPGDEH